MNLTTVLECIMSFMCMINRRGPKMEPCGTPTVMSFLWIDRRDQRHLVSRPKDTGKVG